MAEQHIEDSRAPLMTHIVELRQRLIRSVIAIAIGFVICFAFSKQIYNILVWPYQYAVGSDREIEMIFTAPQEFFFTQIRLALFGALFLAFPMIQIQIYKFVAPGLYRQEQDAFRPYLIATPLLFILGAAVVYFFVMPLAMTFFLSMEQTGGEGQVQILLSARVSEYLSLIMTLIFAFGICFQLPVLLTLLARVGIVNSEQLRGFRRYAIVAAFVAAAILTPPDPISQISLAIPTILLYEASIFSVRFVEKKKRAAQASEPSSGESSSST